MKPRPLLEIWPGLEHRAGFSVVGDFPTPVEPLGPLIPALAQELAECHVKRDDSSSPLYGGNKVRTLEPLFWQAQREGHAWVAATGAYGSNHSVATSLHGARLGFRCAALLFPQPLSRTAQDNLRVSIARSDELFALPHWSALPLGMWLFERNVRRRGESALVMPPGGASPRGALGFVSAGLELGMQVGAGALPAPAEIVIAVGSTCSTAGLLVGLLLATRLGLGFGERRPGAPRPLLVAVRVTPWPVTSAFRILGLAGKVAGWLRELTGERVFAMSPEELARGLEIDGRHLGRGYGRPSREGLRLIEKAGAFAAALDTTYSAKSAAALLDRVRRRPRAPRLFWSTKSSVPLPEVSPAELSGAPRGLRRWLRRPLH